MGHANSGVGDPPIDGAGANAPGNDPSESSVLPADSGLAFEARRSFLHAMLQSIIALLENTNVSDVDAEAQVHHKLQMLLTKEMSTMRIETLPDFYATTYNSAIRQGMARLINLNDIRDKKGLGRIVDLGGGWKMFRGFKVVEGDLVAIGKNETKADTWVWTPPLLLDDTTEDRIREARLDVDVVYRFYEQFPQCPQSHGGRPSAGNASQGSVPNAGAPQDGGPQAADPQDAGPQAADPQAAASPDAGPQAAAPQAAAPNAHDAAQDGPGERVAVAHHLRALPGQGAGSGSVTRVERVAKYKALEVLHGNRLICPGLTMTQMLDCGINGANSREYSAGAIEAVGNLLAGLCTPDLIDPVFELVQSLVVRWNTRQNDDMETKAFSPPDENDWSALDHWKPKQDYLLAEMNRVNATAAMHSSACLAMGAKIGTLEAWLQFAESVKLLAQQPSRAEWQDWSNEVTQAYRWAQKDPTYEVPAEVNGAPREIENDIIVWGMWREHKFGNFGLSLPDVFNRRFVEKQGILKEAAALKTLTDFFGSGVLWPIVMLTDGKTKLNLRSINADCLQHALETLDMAHRRFHATFGGLNKLGNDGEPTDEWKQGYTLKYAPSFPLTSESKWPPNAPLIDVYRGLRFASGSVPMDLDA